MQTYWWQNLFKMLIILSIPPVLLLGNVYFLLSTAFISYEYKLSDFPSSYRYPPSKRLALAKTIVGYLRDELKKSDIRGLKQREISHLDDVKRLFGKVFMVQRIAAALVLLSCVILATGQSTRRQLLPAFSAGGLLTFVLLILVATVALINFSWLFTIFHRSFFVGNSWLFPPDSSLIQLFPLKLWQDALKYLILATITEGAILAAGRFIRVES